jgi:hypothetical protein
MLLTMPLSVPPLLFATCNLFSTVGILTSCIGFIAIFVILVCLCNSRLLDDAVEANQALVQQEEAFGQELRVEIEENIRKGEA